jgi:thiamine monophosphate synthase
LVAAGADFLAVCNAVWGADDPGGEVAKFAELFAI